MSARRRRSAGRGRSRSCAVHASRSQRFSSQKEREDVGKHATPKPLKLCDRVIKSSSREKDLVIDFFLGSGSTLIACQQTKRKCYGIELDEHYTAVCVLRWVKYMQKENRKFIIKRNGEEFNYKEIIKENDK